MESEASIWRDFFLNWPSQLSRRGVVVVSYDEQIPFDNFLTREHVILFERRAPDALGARKVLVQFSHILGVKIVDPVKASVFQAAGFQMPDVAPTPAPVAASR